MSKALKHKRTMKKIIILLFFLLSFSSCQNNLNTATGLKIGDKRFTETDYCIVVEKCVGFNSLNDALWKYERIIPKYSIKQEILIH